MFKFLSANCSSFFVLLLAFSLPPLAHASTVCTEPSFNSATNFAVGSLQSSVAVGDINHDGNSDLVAVLEFTSNVSILLGVGDGSFSTATNVFVGGGLLRSVAIGDLNGDDNPDLAVANYGSNTVSILLGAGDGTFSVATNFAAGSRPYSIATEDLNGDGNLDLAVANGLSNNVSILLGIGDGSFGASTNIPVGVNPFSVAVDDLDGDDNPDLAVANYGSNSVSVRLGVGDGSFGAAANFAVGMRPNSVAVGDLNGDDSPDLVVANIESNSVSVLFGVGDGSFGLATNITVGLNPYSVATGDFNRDDNLDLVVANLNDHNVSILLGVGNGSFGTATNFAVGPYPYFIAVKDLNGDSGLDLVIANYVQTHHVSVLLNTCVPLNHAPVLSTTGDQTIDEGELLQFTLNATDPDDDELTFSVTNLPSGASFDPQTGVFSWTPDFDDAGAYPNIEFTVTDDKDPALSDSETITITVVDVPPLELTSTADAFLRDGNDNRNEGANPRLIIQDTGNRRGLVAFDEEAIADYVTEHGITSATLILSIAENGNNWGATGRTVDAHPLLTTFAEGNGKNAGVPASESTRGEGAGVTWNCATDTAIENQATDCDPQWNGGTYGAATAPGALHTNDLTGTVTWDVTEDILNGSTGWLIKKTLENQNGKVEYYSREGAAAAGNLQLAPRVVLTP
jgi:hypothetical protein